MIRDILLQLTSYPVPTPDWAFDAAASLAEWQGARVSVALCRPYIPAVSNYLADILVDADRAIAQENQRSQENARMLARVFAERIADRLRGEQIPVDSPSLVSGARVAEHARVSDLVIVPAPEQGGHQEVMEELVFAAGRPVLLLPHVPAPAPFARIHIAWDGGRAAARALADALPWCRDAGDVRLVVVTGEKPVSDAAGIEAAQRHLERHGINAAIDDVAAEGMDAGTALLRHARETGADLLVAGAFGHSRLREFILGGATRSLIAAPQVPVLLSH